MALLLPSTTYRPESGEQARRHTLNTIIEDEPQLTQRYLASWSPTKVTVLSPVFSDSDQPTPRAAQQDGRRSTHVATDYFDDLYDLTDSETEEVKVGIEGSPKQKKARYPSIVIPSPSAWPTIQKFQDFQKTAGSKTSPAPLLSPSARSLAMLATRNLQVPSSSAAPSLDGSLTSDDLSSLSCPSTPDLDSLRHRDEDWGAPIQLHPAALQTLQGLSQDEADPDHLHEVPMGEMQEATSQRPTSASFTFAAPDADEAEPLSAISVPSPGGFFSSLDAHARTTWCPSPDMPPSTSTAESFYGVPWRAPPAHSVAEQTVDAADSLTDGPPTARLVPAAKADSDAGGIWTTPEAYEYNENYQSELQATATSNIDRTSLWLNAQDSYLDTLLDGTSLSDAASSRPAHSRQPSLHSLTSPTKSVRFAPTSPAEAPESPLDPTFVNGFRHLATTAHPTDAFTHRKTRTDALTLDRRCLFPSHLAQLTGSYGLSSPTRPSPVRPVSHFYAAEASEHGEAIARAQKERQALNQIRPVAWNLEATKLLNGGTLLTSPTGKLMHRHPGAKILDLGGLATCDWAWQVALEHPLSTVTTAFVAAAQPPHPGLARPLNHRHQRVPNLWTLPFPAAAFDVVSARSLHQLLKARRPPGQAVDEYDLCLAECLRVLKPGGYLEFAVLDADILAPGPLAGALSVEFAFNLRTRGYDAQPTRSFLPRLRKAGFAEIKRAWLALPMARVDGLEGGEGSTADASQISGMVGAWAWERWVVQLNAEMGRVGERVYEGVGEAVEEGRGTGAAWRYLSGWARK